jgi:putative membrane protein
VTTPTSSGARTWERLHPVSPLIRGARAATALVVLLAVSSVDSQSHANSRLNVDAAIIGGVLILGVIQWLVTRWWFDGVTLHVETGLLRRDSRTIPVARIQSIDLVQPLLAKVFGVAELRIRVAGTGKDERLAYLNLERALGLRASLLASHHGLDPSTPEPGELPLAVVPASRLAWSIVLSGSTVVLVGFLIAVGATTAVSPKKGVAVAAFGFVYLLGLLTGVWRRFNTQYGFTVASAPDGIRVRRGLVGSVSETIPSRRVQALRTVEPIVWQPLHWCRLEVDLAGIMKRERGAGSSSVTKTLLPVGSMELATAIRSIVVTDLGVVPTPPPRRTMWKAPLSYHNLAAGHDDEVAVATTGRLRRVTAWVPLEKVQSVRRVQGPIQRALGVATIHLDVAGRRVDASFKDRDVTEADRLVEDLTALCRAARARVDTPGATRR